MSVDRVRLYNLLSDGRVAGPEAAPTQVGNQPENGKGPPPLCEKRKGRVYPTPGVAGSNPPAPAVTSLWAFSWLAMHPEAASGGGRGAEARRPNPSTPPTQKAAQQSNKESGRGLAASAKAPPRASVAF